MVSFDNSSVKTPAPARSEFRVEVRHTGRYNPKGHPIASYTMLKFLGYDPATGHPIIRRTELPHRTIKSFEKKHFAAGNKYLRKLHGYWNFKF